MIRVLNSSFAAERLMAAKEFVKSFPAGSELLLIGASRDCVDDLVRDLSSIPHATFGLHRFSLAQLATRLALPRLAKSHIAPASTLGLEAVVARAAHDALTDQQLQYFSPVADCSGFVRAASATLHELRMSGTPEDAVRALPYSGADNAALLCRFEKYLTDAGIADRAVVFRTATESIRAGTVLTRLPVLLLDVVIHSALEGDLIAALADSSPHLLITIPAGDVLTSNQVAAIPNQQEVQPGPIKSESSLARLGCYLFSDNTPPEGTVDDHVVFMSAPGQERECVEMARLIVKEAKGGVRFDNMAVLLRSPDKYVGVIQSAFRRAEVPAYFLNGNRRPHPAGRALLALLNCATEGLSVHRFSEYLSFAQVPSLSDSGCPPFETDFDAIPEDEALGIGMATGALTAEDSEEQETETESEDGRKPELAGSLRTPWRWEEVLVEAAVIGGKERWARRLRGLESQFRLELEVLRGEETDSAVIQTSEQRLLNLQHLANFALPLIDTLASMPKSAKWGDWLTILESLAVKALRRPERVLTLIAEMNPMADVGPISLNEVLNVLKDKLANVQQQSAHHRYGQVFVGTHDQARGHSFEIVFVPGLAERMFPQKLREDPLLLDELRKQLSKDLLVQFGRGQRERLFLQIAVGAAKRRLYLSYPRSEIAEPRPRVPSSYALDIVRAITGRIPDFEKLAGEPDRSTNSRLSWPAPDNPSSAIDDAEFDLAVLRPLISMSSQDRKGRFAYVKKENDHLFRSLRNRWSRWDKERWWEYDGLCTKSPAVIDILKSHRLNSRAYSASALQTFAVCPYQFFLSSIHGLRSKPERHAVQQIDPLTRGHLFHKVQAATLRRLQTTGKLPINDSSLAAALTVLNTTLDEIAARYYENLSPAIDQVWHDSIERMRLDLRGWLHLLAREERWEPIHFEFGFGFGAAADRDPASLLAPAVLSSGHRLHGIVDLIECCTEDQNLRVTDHKTGSNDGKTGAIIAGGESLQPVLYALAVESVLNTPVTDGRLSFCTAAGGFSERVVHIDQNARENISTLLGIIDSAIEDVFLVPAPKPKACTHCKFITVCGPYEEIRISSKSDQGRLKQLQRVRKLR